MSARHTAKAKRTVAPKPSVTVSVPVIEKTTVEDTRPHWTVDKRVPVALIISMLIQTAGVIWWAAGMNSSVQNLERAVASFPDVRERVVKLETRLETIGSTLGEIKGSIARLATLPPLTVNRGGKVSRED